MLLALIAFHPLWLAALGHALESADRPEKSDVVVVLAGDAFGNRILKGCELVRDGYAPIALVSGPSGNYDHYESDLAIPFAVKHGCRPEWFTAIPSDSRSTREEAAVFAGELHRRAVKSCLLVTNDYHTRRAGRLFRDALPDLRIRVIAAPDAEYSADNWWRSRQGTKVFALEWLKTVTGWFGV